MKKTFQLSVEGKNRDRVLESVKNEIRKYIKRERRRDLPAGADYLDFDCKFGLTLETAAVVHPGNITSMIDEAAKSGAEKFYIEILAKPGIRKSQPLAPAGGDGVDKVDKADMAHIQDEADGNGDGGGSAGGDGGGGD